MSLPHVRERLAEMIMTTETMRACLRAAEADAARRQLGRHSCRRAPPLDTARNLFPAALSADGGNHPAQQLLAA